MNVGQSIAIVNCIGRLAGTEGKDDTEYAMSQMLQPTIFAKYGDKGKQGPAENATFWAETAPAEMAKLEKLLAKGSGDTFTSSGTTVGELYLFAMLHQMKLC